MPSRLSLIVALLAIATSTVAASTSGPLYAEYQPPIEIHNRFMGGALIVCTGLLFGGLLFSAGRRLTGAILGALMIGFGVLLIFSRSLGI